MCIRDSNKRGSLYVEASMVMPMVFMIITGLIGIVMWFNGCLFEQVNNHLNMWNELNKGIEAKYIDVYKRQHFYR